MEYRAFIRKHNLILAPMAGVTDSAFRVVCQQQGAKLTYTEMVSMKALSFGDKKTRRLLELDPAEQDVVVQMFGSEPDVMARGAEELCGMGCFRAIDINMGCPAPKIVNNGEGCRLMTQPEKAEAIIRQVVAHSTLPVTVKFRKGFTHEQVNAVEFAQMAEAAGASAVCVHGRTRSQFYAPSADWDIIARVKQAVSIPVIGNGDVTTPQEAKALLEQTGCDAIMVGRAALGNPFLFGQIAAYLERGELLPPPTPLEKIQVARQHLRLMAEKKGERVAMLEARKHIAWYCKGLPHSGVIKAAANTIVSLEDMERVLRQAEELYG
ncbi:MAG: tRNA dihydrouridine synthase DusB [Eubacteriales bacterium]